MHSLVGLLGAGVLAARGATVSAVVVLGLVVGVLELVVERRM